MREYVDRHVVTKQRSPSNREMVRRCEALLEKEETEAGRAQIEKALTYWKEQAKRRRHDNSYC